MVAIPYVRSNMKCNKRAFDTYVACVYACRQLSGRPYLCNVCSDWHWKTSTKSNGRSTRPDHSRVLLSSTTRWRWWKNKKKGTR